MGMRLVDVSLLAFLGAARQQDHQRLAVQSEINPVARPKVDAILKYAFADRLHVGKIALLQADDRACNFGSRNSFQICEPPGERFSAIGSHVIANFGHWP